jgi:hypothetical protein
MAAAPNYILVSGPGLRHPVLLGNWKENGVVLLAVANSRVARRSLWRDLVHRRRFDLAEFWGWSGKPRPTKPSDANQHGWFYPAHGSQVALIEITVNAEFVPRLVPARVLKILRHHGVPIRF